MKFKVTLRRSGGDLDLSVTADATASVSDVAAYLAAADPSGGGGAAASGITLRTRPAGGSVAPRVLDGDTGILESGIQSGSVIELVEAYPASAREQGHVVAVLRIVAGPDAGKEFSLSAGASIIGRDRDVDVRLSDPLISKRHARINVGEHVEITDLNSANGVVVSGDQVTRATIRPSDVAVLGETALSVTSLQGGGELRGAQLEHVRSPRVIPRYPGTEILTPKPPGRPQPQRLPLVALAAPLLMGAVLYAINPNPASVVMMMMSPLLLIGAWVDQRFTAQRVLKQQKKDFSESMLRLQETLEQERLIERRVRVAEAPSLADLEAALTQRGALLWTVRPEHDGFLNVRLGCGRSASRNVIALPSSNESMPEYWEQLEQLKAEFSMIDEVPIVAELRRDGALGVAGPSGKAMDVARGLLLQALALHSPAELVAAAVASPGSSTDWDWLKWVPHTSSPHSPLGGVHLADSPTTASGLLAQLEGLIDARLAGKAPGLRGAIDGRPATEAESIPLVPSVLVLVTDDAPVDRGRLTRLAERGSDAGVFVLWSAPSVSRLPAVCRSFVSVDELDSGGLAGLVRLGDQVHPLDLEGLTQQRAEALAREMAPVVDVGSPVEDDSDLPRQVSYAALAGQELLDSPEFVIERWVASNSLIVRDGSAPIRRRKEGHLRALVGHAGAAPLVLDLRRDGPHALVGGTTGAGKSEFLQSWVLGMAAANSPDRLTFLFVDYKGGAAFADCVKLPHTVGLVTDLSQHLVRRALTSLRAELRYREHVLQRKKAKDLVSLEKTGDPECPPSLIIIVDEFAALVQEVPDFVDGVVDVAQRGRSLGLHLILATQRPAGVIKDNLRANTNLRVALRMADTDDSVDILGDPMAAHFDSSTPGRGAAKTGPGRIQTFQTGYAGGWTTNEPPRPRIDVGELRFGAGAAWELPEQEAVEADDPGPNDIARIVTTLRAAAASAGVPEPRKPWLDELAPVYNLKRLPNPRTDERLLLGVIDLPESQSQPTFFYEPDRDGNIAFFGTGGSGKSTALRTVAAAAAFTMRGGPIQIYGLDFGSRGLHMLEELPHVGSIIDGDDEERVIRLLRKLRELVDERSERYSAVRASTITEYRALASAPQEPRILLLIDGIGAFRERYEFGTAQTSAWFTTFAQIAADGRQVGVHVVMSADRPNSIPQSIASTVQRRVVLRLADAEEYLLLGAPKDVLNQTSPPGRGVLDGNEVQFAILGDSQNVALQAREVQELAEVMKRAGTPSLAPIGRLPEQLWLSELDAALSTGLVIGMDDVTLGAATIKASGTLLLAGPPGSGRTTALNTIVASLTHAEPHVARVLLSARKSQLVNREWAAKAEGPEAVAALASQLNERVASGQLGRVALIVEHLSEFGAGEAEFPLSQLIKTVIREDGFVVGESETSTWGQAWALGQAFKAGRRGLLLMPGEMDGENLLGTPLGRLRRADFPPGRGFMIQSGVARKLQIAVEGL
jgi:DNA segregation ATPase FtsK/SpoIIIE, S-DNA-T family